MKKVCFFICMFLILFGVVKAEELTNYSPSAILIEPTTNSILYELNVHERRAPASMTKLMTMLLIMEAIDDGRIGLEDKVIISKNAASMGGSQVFLQENMEILVTELLKSICITSGNDAAVAMAEYIGGTTENFVNMMNDKANELGLKNTHFMNVHGLDQDDHYSSAYDMSQIAVEILKHPKILEYTSLYEEYLNKPDGTRTWLVNTNKLVRFYNGVDGLKTGFTKNAMYCLTATAKKNDIRFVTVVMGVDTNEHRSQDTTSLLNYGFSTYKLNTVLKKDDFVENVGVLRGIKDKVDVVLGEDVTDLIKQNEKKDYNYKFDIGTLSAPLKSGDIVGYMDVLDNNGKLIKKVSLTVKEDVGKHNFVSLFVKMFKKALCGY